MYSGKSSGANKCWACKIEDIEPGGKYCPACLARFYNQLDDLDALHGITEHNEREVINESSSDIEEYNV